MAIAAIAPDKKQYASFRSMALANPDFIKDYHAKSIFLALSKNNKWFYPKPLAAGLRQPDGSWHFGNKQSGFLSKNYSKRPTTALANTSMPTTHGAREKACRSSLLSCLRSLKKLTA